MIAMDSAKDIHLAALSYPRLNSHVFSLIKFNYQVMHRDSCYKQVLCVKVSNKLVLGHCCSCKWLLASVTLLH